MSPDVRPTRATGAGAAGGGAASWANAVAVSPVSAATVQSVSVMVLVFIRSSELADQLLGSV